MIAPGMADGKSFVCAAVSKKRAKTPHQRSRSR